MRNIDGERVRRKALTVVRDRVSVMCERVCVGEWGGGMGDGYLLALGDRGTLGGREDELRVHRVLLLVEVADRRLWCLSVRERRGREPESYQPGLCDATSRIASAVHREREGGQSE